MLAGDNTKKMPCTQACFLLMTLKGTCNVWQKLPVVG